MEAFDRSLSHIEGLHMGSCERIVDVTTGRVGSNHSYGGICELESSNGVSDVLLCTDTMVGHFALKTGVFGNDREDIARFTKRNCTGG